ncbi:hypothetical protein [Yersinia massiliensis]|uniref:hypothetical protein n=1 Tax=Yersinia massiliensis TaxID=419257 RepID=UPI00131F1660|nr:hypothetical protein [Yersinia massiliensis]QKJ11531.1 hypothetical protein HRD68_12835 [Yersinia massiliensis]
MDGREKRVWARMPIALAREPKDVGGLPAGQYFAQAAGAGGPACPPARLRLRG